MTHTTRPFGAAVTALGLAAFPFVSACGTGSNAGTTQESPFGATSGVAAEFDHGRRAPGASEQTGLRRYRKTDIRSGTDIVAACASGKKQTTTSKMNFPSTRSLKGNACKDEYPGTDDVIRGMRKQVAALALPANVVLCGAGFDAQSGDGANAPWSFDDEVVLTLNDVVLATSQHEYVWENPASRTAPSLPAFGSGFLFDWERLASRRLNNTQGDEGSQYCYGDRSATRCRLPITQKAGVLALAFDADAFSEIAFKALREGELNSALWVTGDNDPAIDCRHSGIEIEATLEYVQLAAP